MSNNQSRLVILAIALIVIAMVAAIFANIYVSAGRQRVEIVTVPKDATVTTPYGEYKQGSHYLPYGEYTITIARDGFESNKQLVTIDRSSRIIPLAIQANDDTGQKYLEDNPDELRRYETLGAMQSRRVNDQLQESYPFLNQLPNINLEDGYSLHYGVDEGSSNLVYFVIGESSTSGRHKAIAWLQKNGIDISRADIRYKDFTSPLQSEITIKDLSL